MRPKVPESEKHVKQTISMSPQDLERIEEYCQREERTISWVIRKALQDFFEKHNV